MGGAAAGDLDKQSARSHSPQAVETLHFNLTWDVLGQHWQGCRTRPRTRKSSLTGCRIAKSPNGRIAHRRIAESQNRRIAESPDHLGSPEDRGIAESPNSRIGATLAAGEPPRNGCRVRPGPWAADRAAVCGPQALPRRARATYPRLHGRRLEGALIQRAGGPLNAL